MLAAITAGIQFLLGLVGLGNKAADAAHDATERKAGSDATTAATQQATIASLERQNQAAVNKGGTDATIKSMQDGTF